MYVDHFTGLPVEASLTPSIQARSGRLALSRPRSPHNCHKSFDTPVPRASRRPNKSPEKNAPLLRPVFATPATPQVKTWPPFRPFRPPGGVTPRGAVVVGPGGGGGHVATSATRGAAAPLVRRTDFDLRSTDVLRGGAERARETRAPHDVRARARRPPAGRPRRTRS